MKCDYTFKKLAFDGRLLSTGPLHYRYYTIQQHKKVGKKYHEKLIQLPLAIITKPRFVMKFVKCTGVKAVIMLTTTVNSLNSREWCHSSIY
ncbi:MAG TPA: hypothetical protein VE619_10800, partial [Nitrososphaeraceae archaeon]|nr:hypothetical protein [Nitrososphaeraceae archaeon]